MRRPRTIALAALGALSLASAAGASHIPGKPCSDCTSHKYWPTITGGSRRPATAAVKYRGTSRSDELLGHHGSDDIRGGDGSGRPLGRLGSQGAAEHAEGHHLRRQRTDFIYGSHGSNEIYAGNGNDVISVHYGRGRVDCGPGRDIYHVARSRKSKYKFLHCEKVDYRPEAVRGGPLKPLE